jgi:hypothetical protein
VKLLQNVIDHLSGQTRIDSYPECPVHDGVGDAKVSDNAIGNIAVSRLADQIAAKEQA